MGALLGALAVVTGALAATGVTLAAAAGSAPPTPREALNPRLEHRASLATARPPSTPSRRGASAAASPSNAPALSSASALSSCQGTWSLVPSANAANHNEMVAVAAVNANDIWGVGLHTTADGIWQTLAEHWDGDNWAVVPSPNAAGNLGTGGTNILESVAAVASNDAWAVGISRASGSGPFSTLTEHWDGTTWTIVPSPNPNLTASNALFSVKGDAANDYWAVGRSFSGTSATTLAEHWDGTSWTIVNTPSPSPYSELIAVAVLGQTNVWAVGSISSDNVNFQTLIEHYDGTNWTVSTSSQSGLGNGLLFGIAGTASDLYAVGAGQSTGFDVAFVEHWNGTAWSTMSSVATGSDTDLFSVAYVAPGNVWAVGANFGGTQSAPRDQTVIEHWDGNSWAVATSPNNGVSADLFDVAAVSGSDVWSVGSYINSSGMLQTLSENHCVPPTITGINPTSGPATGGTSVTITGTGLVWAKGVNFGTTFVPRPGPNSDTQIMATSPAGRAGTVDVRVVYFAGQSATTTADRFTYTATLPTAPQNVAAVAGDSSAIVYWAPPASDGGVTLSAYTITPYLAAVAQTPATINGSPPPTSTTITGLTNGLTYTFKVSATNSAGQGPDSAPSNAVTPSTTAVAAGPEVSSWGRGRLDVFIKGADGALWHKFYDASVGWIGWSSLGAPTGVTLASDPVAISWGYARIDIFVRGSDNHLWHKYYDVNLGGWSAWYNHGGTLTSGPAATSWGYGRLDVFYRGSDNTLRHIYYAAFIGAWSSEYTHGGGLASDPSAVSWGVGRIDVVARGTDGLLQHNDYDQSRSGWLTNWETVPGDTLASGPTVTTWGPGRLDVMARGTDNALHHTYFYGGLWRGWTTHVNPPGNVLISDPGAVAWSAGRLDIFARGANNTLLHKFYDSSVGWSDWFSETLSPTPG